MIASGFSFALLLSIVAVATGATSSFDSGSGVEEPGKQALPVAELPDKENQLLTCTGPDEPVNFETFSAGKAPGGLAPTGVSRRCDVGIPAEQWPANYVSYSYGECEIPKGSNGCQPPLVIQTWPACQRTLADYSYEGEPIPHESLAKEDAARVVEFDFEVENRIEVYTKESTIVIFATDPKLAKEAVDWLRPLDEDEPPASKSAELVGEPGEQLAAPKPGAVEGRLACSA